MIVFLEVSALCSQNVILFIVIAYKINSSLILAFKFLLLLGRERF